MRFTLTLAVLALFDALGVASAFAQRQPEAPDRLDEIRVTAQRVLQPRQDVPGAVDTVSRAEFERAGLVSTVDVFDLIPGTNLLSGAGSHRSFVPTVRGISPIPQLISGFEQPLAVYVDDVFIGNIAGIGLDLLDVERVELLRGPQGTLHGKNAVAGALKIYTAEPGDTLAGEASAAFGNFGYRNIRAMGNAAPIPGRLQTRIAAAHTARDGTVRNLFDDGLIDTVDSWTVRAKAAFDPDPSSRVVLSLDYAQDRPIVTAAGASGSIFDRRVFISDPYDERRDVYGASGRLSWRLDGAELTAITALRGLTFNALGSDFDPDDFLLQSFEDRQWQASQEFRLASPAQDRLRWVAGTFLFYQNFQTEAFQILTGLAPLFGVAPGHRETSVAEEDSYHAALFGELGFKITPQLELFGGLRYSVERKSIGYRHFANDGMAVLATAQARDDSVESDSVAPKIGLSYRWTPGLMTYGKVERGSKSGGFNNVFVTGSDITFAPETAWSYEIGAKSSWFDRRLAVDVAAFLMRLDDQQVTTYTQEFGTFTSNAAESESRGIELTVRARPWPSLTFAGGAAFVDSRFTRYPNFPTPSFADPRAAADVTDNRVPFVSRTSFNLAATHATDIGHGLRLASAVRYDYKGPLYFDVLNELREPGHGFLGAELAVAGGWWEVALWGRNLLDEDHRLFAIDLGPARGVAAIAGTPRTFGVRMTVRH